MPSFLKSGQFWAGVVTGFVVGPWVANKFMPRMKSNIPS